MTRRFRKGSRAKPNSDHYAERLRPRVPRTSLVAPCIPSDSIPDGQDGSITVGRTCCGPYMAGWGRIA